MKREVISAAAVACLALCAISAFAESSASASLSNIMITLYDLDPLDGIAPSVIFSDVNGSSTQVAQTTRTPFSQTQNSGFSGSDFGTVSSSVSGSVAQAAAAISGDAFAGTGLATASGSSGAGDAVSTIALANIADTGAVSSFTLSANTVLSISAAASLSASATNDSFSGITVALQLAGTVDGIFETDSANFATDAGLTDGYPADSVAGGDFDVSFANATASPVTGFFVGYIYVVTESFDAAAPPPPMPEPSTLALMGVGLAAIGLARRRRRA